MAAAIAARRYGFRVTVVDGAMPPVDKTCGEGIMPDGLAAAAAIGIRLDPSLGFLFRGIRFVEGKISVEAAFPHGAGLGIRRTRLHAALVEQAGAAGVRLLWGARVTGLDADGALVDGRRMRARWIVGADGGQSRIQRWAGLTACRRDSLRFGFRRHFRIAPWSDHMELHWSRTGQLYITPVDAEQVCAVYISRDSRARLDEALPLFPEAAQRLAAARAVGPEAGGVSATRRLRAVTKGNVALIGDASGSVDAITGEGLCLLFQQARVLAGAMAAGNLRLYEVGHRAVRRRPARMADLMLLLDRHHGLRRRTLRAFAKDPQLFREMLRAHVGDASGLAMAGNGLSLGWRLLAA